MCRRQGVAAAIAACAVAAGGAAAQPAPTVSLRPAASLTLSASDNQRLESTAPVSDLVVQPELGLRFASRGAMLRGDVDYRLTGLVYTRDSENDSLQNTLNGRLSLLMPDNRGDVTADASISQQPRAAFRRYAPDAAVGRAADRTEVRSLQIAPALQGRLGSALQWNGRAALRSTRSSDDSTAAVDTLSAHLAIGPDSGDARLTPGIVASGTVYDFGSGRRTSQAALLGSLSYAVDRELRVGLQGGAETDNFRTVARVTNPAWGVTLGWFPGPRTSLDLVAQQREASNTHELTFGHRFARAAVQFRDSRSVVAPDATTQPTSIVTAYDVVFLQFARYEPTDLAKRRELVEGYLRERNIDPLSQVLANLLTNSLLDQRTRSLAVSWTGVRQTATLTASRNDSRRIDALTQPGSGDGFSSSQRLVQSGLAFTISHRLTATADLAVDAALRRTTDETGRRASLRSVGLNWLARLGPRTSVSVGARRLDNRSNVDPYDATVLTTTARLEF